MCWTTYSNTSSQQMSVELAFEPQVIPITAFIGKHMRFMELYIYMYTRSITA